MHVEDRAHILPSNTSRDHLAMVQNSDDSDLNWGHSDLRLFPLKYMRLSVYWCVLVTLIKYITSHYAKIFLRSISVCGHKSRSPWPLTFGLWTIVHVLHVFQWKLILVIIQSKYLYWPICLWWRITLDKAFCHIPTIWPWPHFQGHSDCTNSPLKYMRFDVHWGGREAYLLYHAEIFFSSTPPMMQKCSLGQHHFVATKLGHHDLWPLT